MRLNNLCNFSSSVSAPCIYYSLNNKNTIIGFVVTLLVAGRLSFTLRWNY